MHSVALEKAFPMMCLDYSFIMIQNPLKLAKPKAISLAFFPENEPFLKLTLRAYNLSYDSHISKLKHAIGSSKEDLSNDVFRFELYDWSKSIKIAAT